MVLRLFSMLYCITFASRSKKNYDVTEAQIANKFVFLDFNVTALCNLGFAICGSSYMEQVWPPLYITLFSVFHVQHDVTYNQETTVSSNNGLRPWPFRRFQVSLTTPTKSRGAKHRGSLTQNLICVQARQ